MGTALRADRHGGDRRGEERPDAGEYNRDLELFAGDDSEAAAPAFSRLWRRVQKPLYTRLRQHGLSHADSEDILQSAGAKIWNTRSTFRPNGPAAWWAFARQITHRQMLDEIRKEAIRPPLGEVADLETIPERDLPYLNTLLVAAEDSRSLYEAADRLWLGSLVDDPDFLNRLLAAQLFFAHGSKCKEIAALFAGALPSDVDSWLMEPAVLRHVSYRELYWENDRLAGYILRPKAPYSPAELDKLPREIALGEFASADWRDAEALVVLWRIRNGLLTEQVARFDRCDLDSEGLERLFHRFRERFPFAAIALKLKRAIAMAGGPPVLRAPEIWRRLAFQYHLRDQLPLKQILERTQPAAEAAEAKLTHSTLVGWIGMGRLLSQLAAYIDKEGLNAAQ